MKTNELLAIVTVIFGLIAALHFIRAVLGIPVMFGSFIIPVWWSWIIGVIAGYLGYQAWKLH
jgi:hypothetical protein